MTRPSRSILCNVHINQLIQEDDIMNYIVEICKELVKQKCKHHS